MEWKTVEFRDQGLLRIPKRWLHIHYYEALNILFRFENSVRVFVYAVLKNEFGEGWQTCCFSVPNADPQSIKGMAARRISQAENFGYLGFDIRAPLMHLTSGELIELLTSDAYWPKFKAYFKGDKGIIKNKLLEIGSIRNSLAHFRPIKPDDIAVVKQNSRHTLVGVEQCLTSIFEQPLRVPTNTSDDWYKSISTLGTEQITTTPYFSSDESWINVKLTFATPILHRQSYNHGYHSYKFAKLNPANILVHHSELRKRITYVSEALHFPTFTEDFNLHVPKDLNFVFRKDVLTTAHKEISTAFADVLHEVADECELLLKDNLARGKVVEPVSGSSYFHKEEGKEGNWRHQYGSLRQPYEASHPDEYWGQTLSGSDIVGARPRYPWMPADISESESIWDLLE